LWRIGPKTLSSFFPKKYFEILHLEKEGNKKLPRRTMILVKKKKSICIKYEIPKSGKTNWKLGLTIFN